MSRIHYNSLELGLEFKFEISTESAGPERVAKQRAVGGEGVLWMRVVADAGLLILRSDDDSAALDET